MLWRISDRYRNKEKQRQTLLVYPSFGYWGRALKKGVHLKLLKGVIRLNESLLKILEDENSEDDSIGTDSVEWDKVLQFYLKRKEE